METDKITYKLENTGDRETSLKKAATDIRSQLQSRFGSEYTITADEFGVFDKDWSHEIKVRKGNKVGAEVGFKWEQSQPDVLVMEVDESSKMGSQLTYGISIVLGAVGAYLAYNDMAPLEFLPGKKIAGGLGGLIGVILGLIIASVLKSVLLKNEKEQNAQLVNEVRQIVTR